MMVHLIGNRLSDHWDWNDARLRVAGVLEQLETGFGHATFPADDRGKSAQSVRESRLALVYQSRFGNGILGS